MSRLPLAIFCALPLVAGSTACANGQPIPASRHLEEIAKAFPCGKALPVEISGPEATREPLKPYACSLVRQAIHMVASGKAARFGVTAADTAKFRSASVMEFRFPAFDVTGKPEPASDEAYWAVTLLFDDPPRTIEHDVYIGSRKTLIRRTEPMDSVSIRRPPQ